MNAGTETQYQAICSCLPKPIADPLRCLDKSIRDRIQEIRLRIGQPLSIFDGREICFLSFRGTSVSPDRGIILTQELLRGALIGLCGYSLHSHSSELEKGYLTASGGCRVGVVMDGEGTADAGIPIALNIRIAKERPGVSEKILPCWNKASGLIIAGPPGSGKTTILRDIAKKTSLKSQKVTVIDERYELSGMCRGIPSFDLGPCTDILAGMEKAKAIRRSIRVLSPRVILCDEVASEHEITEIRSALYCGVKFLVTVHCGGREDLFSAPMVHSLMETGAFSHLLLLPPDPTGKEEQYLLTREEYQNEMAWRTDGV